MIRSLFALLLCLASLSAQSPPSPFAPVGGANHLQQFSGGQGSQLLAARTSLSDYGNAASWGFFGVKIGGRLWWLTAGTNPNTSIPVTYSPTNTTAVVFGLANFVSYTQTPFGFPGGAPGFDKVWLDTSTLVTVSPFLRSTHQTTSVFPSVQIPSGGYDVDWLYWDVPSNTGLIGQLVAAQTLRLDSNGLWYLSDEHFTEIVQ
jgi:hypothetical protein